MLGLHAEGEWFLVVGISLIVRLPLSVMLALQGGRCRGVQIGGAWAVVCLVGGEVHADQWWLLGFAWHVFLGVGECPVDRWCASGMCRLLALWGGCVCRSTALQIVDVAGPSVACLSESWVVILSMLLLLGQMWHARPCGIGIAYRSSMRLGHLWDACSGAGSVLRLTVLLGHLLCGCCVCGQW